MWLPSRIYYEFWIKQLYYSLSWFFWLGRWSWWTLLMQSQLWYGFKQYMCDMHVFFRMGFWNINMQLQSWILNGCWRYSMPFSLSWILWLGKCSLNMLMWIRIQHGSQYNMRNLLVLFKLGCWSKYLCMWTRIQLEFWISLCFNLSSKCWLGKRIVRMYLHRRI